MQGVNLTKIGASKYEYSQIEGYNTKTDVPSDPIDGYVQNIKNRIQESYGYNKGWKIIDSSVIPDKNQLQCVRIHLLLEKKNSTSDTDDSKKFFTEQYNLSCAMSHLKIGIGVEYTQNYYEANKDPLFAEKANRLLDSVVPFK
jgi:hypothetical protein